jgi:protein gp37
MNRSRIPWLVNADGSQGYTWSPTSGCGPGLPCYERCWARAYHVRYRGGDFSVKLHPEKLDDPLRLRKPSTIGVCLMGDLFHKKVDNNAAYGYPFIASVFGVMASRQDHTFILLTKRPERAREILAGPDRLSRITCPYHARDRVDHPGLLCPSDGPWPLPNVWLGVSVEDQATADERIPILLDTPAAHRWVSLEPQIGPVDFGCWTYNHIVVKCEEKTGERTKWCGGGMFNLPSYCTHGCPHAKSTGGIELVVQGCESGPRRRPFDLQWARDVRDQCKAAGVAYALKQMPIGGRIMEKPGLDDDPEWNLPWVKP